MYLVALEDRENGKASWYQEMTRLDEAETLLSPLHDSVFASDLMKYHLIQSVPRLFLLLVQHSNEGATLSRSVSLVLVGPGRRVGTALVTRGK